MNIPELPISFVSIAAQAVVEFGACMAAVASVIVLSALIRMGINWIRMGFASDVKVEMVSSNTGGDWYESRMADFQAWKKSADYDSYQQNIDDMEGEAASGDYGRDDIPV